MPIDESSSEPTPGTSRRPVWRRALWPWFIAGYAVVFIGLMFTAAYPMNANGDAVIICSLWQYYLREAHRAMTSSGAMGPASGSFSAACEMAIQHIAFSAAAGVAVACIVWCVRRAKVCRRHSE